MNESKSAHNKNFMKSVEDNLVEIDSMSSQI